MKKLLALSLLVSFVQAHCNPEAPTQEQSKPKEPMPLDLIPAYHYGKYNNTAFLLEAALAIGCGVSLPNDNITSSLKYDSQKYPKCEEVLNFLAEFNTAQENLRRNAQKLVSEIAQSDPI